MKSRQSTLTRKRPPLRHIVVASGTQSPTGGGGAVSGSVVALAWFENAELPAEFRARTRKV